MNHRIFIVAFVAFLLVATPVYAAPLSESQINAILGLVRSFGIDAAVVTNVELALRGTPISASVPNQNIQNVPAGACSGISLINRSLSKGMSDADTGGQITLLQRFLANDIAVYPEGTVSGYFGALTERAVERWQIKNGVVTSGTSQTTGLGVVGALTRAAMLTSCSSLPAVVPTPNVSLSVWATIDPFTADSLSPSMTGSVSGTTSVKLLLLNSGNTAYDSGHLVVVNGRWSHTVRSSLAEGTYTIQVRALDGTLLAEGSMILYSSTVQPPVMSFTAQPSAIPYNGESTLSWSAENANNCSLSYGMSKEIVQPKGTRKVTPSGTTSYTLTCSNDPNAETTGPSDSRTVNVTIVAEPTCTLTKTPAPTVSGAIQQYVLNWTSADATSGAVRYRYANASLSPTNLPNVGPSGTMTVTHSSFVEYTFTFTGAGGSKSCTITIN